MTEFDFSTITAEVLEAEVRSIAAERPHYVYDRNKCKYVDRDVDNTPLVPSCLYGHAFHRLGVPLEVMAEWDDRDEGAGVGIESIIVELLPGFTLKDIGWHDNVQCYQDVQFAWGDSIEQADTEG